MRVSEAAKLAKAKGCELKGVGQGRFRLTGPSQAVSITKQELNRTNERALLRLMPGE